MNQEEYTQTVEQNNHRRQELYQLRRYVEELWREDDLDQYCRQFEWAFGRYCEIMDLPKPRIQPPLSEFMFDSAARIALKETDDVS